MKEYGLLDEIIDRENESEKILSAIQNATANEVAFVYSKTAVGKSSLSKKVIEKFNDKNRVLIRVKTNPENNSLKNKEWFFVNKIFDNLQVFFNENSEYSFSTYINKLKDKSLKKQFHETFLEKLSSCKKLIEVIILFLTYPVKRVFKLNEFNESRILEEDSYFTQMVKVRYILFLLSEINFFFVIDNVQNFDSVSWTHFLSWLNATKNKEHYFLLEYTITEENDFENLLSIMEEIRDTNTKVKYFPLKRLDEEYVIDIIDKNFPNKPQNINFNIDLLKEYKKDKSGNIRKLIDYTLNYNPIDKIKEISPTLNNLLTLEEISKYIFSIILNCNGEIQLKELHDLLESSLVMNDDINRAFNELTNKHIIDIFNEKISICHPTLIDEWLNNIDLFIEYQKAAYVSIDKHFSNVLLNSADSDKRNRAWILLIQIYSKNSPEKIIRLLTKIENGTIEKLTPSITWNYLSSLVLSLNQNNDDYFDIMLVIIKICFSLELYNEGYDCIKTLENSSFNNKSKYLTLIIYKSAFLAALDKHIENIELYNNYINIVDEYGKEYFNLKLCVLCSFRSLNQYDKCLEIHKELKKHSKYMDTYDYCIYLRLTNIYFDDNKALYYAKKSVKKFHLLGNDLQEAKSLITYSKLLAGLGKCKKAIKYIKKADCLMGDKYIGRHLIYTNQAAFMLLRGIHDESVWWLLENSECSAVVPYDKLAIIVNKLVWCYENSSNRTLNTLIKKAESLMPLEPDEHIHVLIFYNLYLIFKKNGNYKIAKKYYDLAKKNKEKCKFVNARLNNIKNKEMSFRLKFPWHVCFLSFWTYDIQLLDSGK